MAAKRSTLSLSQSGLSLARFLFAGEASLRGVRSDTNRRDTTSIQKRANQRRPVDSMNTRVAQPSPRWRQRQKNSKKQKKNIHWATGDMRDTVIYPRAVAYTHYNAIRPAREKQWWPNQIEFSIPL